MGKEKIPPETPPPDAKPNPIPNLILTLTPHRGGGDFFPGGFFPNTIIRRNGSLHLPLPLTLVQRQLIVLFSNYYIARLYNLNLIKLILKKSFINLLLSYLNKDLKVP